MVIQLLCLLHSSLPKAIGITIHFSLFTVHLSLRIIDYATHVRTGLILKLSFGATPQELIVFYFISNFLFAEKEPSK